MKGIIKNLKKHAFFVGVFAVTAGVTRWSYPTSSMEHYGVTMTVWLFFAGILYLLIKTLS